MSSRRMTAGMLLLCFSVAGSSLSLTGITPSFGQPGNLITLTGTGFSNATTVVFNTNAPTLADFTNVSATELLVVVPPGATSGALGVFAGALSAASSSNFLVAPVISSFSPQSGASPTTVYILGENFVDNGTTVFFHGVSTGVKATYVGPTEVEAAVPVGAGNGPITVVTSAGTNVSTTNFLASSAPSITSISPTLATNGQKIDIYGGNFFSPATVKFGALTASSTITSTSEIIATVPSGAFSSNIIVTTDYGSATNSSFTTGSGPIITNFTPNFGGLDTYVTLYGFGLETITSVTFNGVSETLDDYSGNSFTVYLANRAGTGPIKVTSPSGTFTTTNYFTNSTAPFINDFNPVLGPPGSTVTIDGLNFTGTPTVKFGSTTASSTITGEGIQLSATVPSLVTGKYAIEVTTTSGSFTTTSNFTVTGTGPVITSFAPSNGVRGTSVTINGANFTNLGSSAVTLNGVTASYQTPTSTTVLTATVPADATTGLLSVTNANGVGASSPSLFYMQPWITSLSSNGAIVNASITLTGRNLTGVSALQINGLSYSNFSVAATQIVATIPSNATSGQIEITGPGGMFITTNVFAILPKIYGFSPNIGPVGTVVTISGTSLFDVTSVEFGGVATSDFTATTNQVQVVVPAGAASGPLTVVTPYGNDTSTNSFTATKPSLVVLTKTASPIVTAPGSEITYTLLVTNEGPSIITSASVTDSLPGNLDFISAATGAGTWSYANGIVTWQIGFLTNGDSVNLGIVSVATNVSALTNFATLTFAEGNLAAIGNSASVTNYAVSNSQRTLSIVLQANPPALQVSWPVSPANFLVQVNTNLNSPWFLPSHAAFVTNSLNIFTDSLSAPQTFFRLAPP